MATSSIRLAAVPVTDSAGLAEAGETAPGGDVLAALRVKGGGEWFWILEWVHDADPGLVARGWAALAEDRRERG